MSESIPGNGSDRQKIFELSHSQILDKIREAPTAAIAAGIWWASAVRNPNMGNGDPTYDAIMRSGSKAMGVAKPEYDSSALESFAGVLSTRVQDMLDDPNDPYRDGFGLQLSVDYTPAKPLSEAAHEAGLEINDGSWPLKTRMTIEPGAVIVAMGMASPLEQIWGEDEPTMLKYARMFPAD